MVYFYYAFYGFHGMGINNDHVYFGLVPTIIVWALLIAIVAAVFDGMDAL